MISAKNQCALFTSSLVIAWTSHRKINFLNEPKLNRLASLQVLLSGADFRQHLVTSPDWPRPLSGAVPLLCIHWASHLPSRASAVKAVEASQKGKLLQGPTCRTSTQTSSSLICVGTEAIDFHSTFKLAELQETKLAKSQLQTGR